MVKYTLAEAPSVIIEVSGKDSNKTRSKALEQLMAKLDNGELPTKLENGFGEKDFIALETVETPPNSQDDEKLIEAVQVVGNLADIKGTIVKSKQEALTLCDLIGKIVGDEEVSEEEIETLKKGIKPLKKTVETLIEYRKLKQQAIAANELLRKVLAQM